MKIFNNNKARQEKKTEEQNRQDTYRKQQMAEANLIIPVTAFSMDRLKL